MSGARDLAVPALGWGRPPTQVWPPCPPARPPDCYSSLYRLEQCFDDVRATKAFLRRVIEEILQDDPSFLSGVGIAGVTDGSDARPGTIGEYLTTPRQFATSFSQVMPWTQMASLALSAGDWDVTAWVELWNTAATQNTWVEGVLATPAVVNMADPDWPNLGYWTAWVEQPPGDTFAAFGVGPVRFSAGAAQTASLIVKTQDPLLGATIGGQCNMTARRVR